MTLNRRNVLKTLLMSPFFGAARKLGANSLFGSPAAGTVNILLHGLFFMELDNSLPSRPLLIIRAPNVRDHTFLAGTRKNLLSSKGFDWSTNSGLIGGTPSIDGQTPGIPKDVSTSILQFTKSQTGVGSFKPDDPSLYFGKVILPWPAGIIPLRLDTFPPVDSGDSQHPKHVAPELINRCGLSQTAVAICLQYGYNFSGPVLPPTTPTMNLHLHMRCCNDSGSTVDHINAALTDAAAIFTVPNFDVQLKKVPVVASGFDDQPPVLGVSPEDERAAIEDGACRVAKTPVGSLMKKLPQHSKVPQKTTNTRAQAKSTEGGGIVSQENVSPANCPHFFVG